MAALCASCKHECGCLQEMRIGFVALAGGARLEHDLLGHRRGRRAWRLERVDVVGECFRKVGVDVEVDVGGTEEFALVLYTRVDHYVRGARVRVAGVGRCLV
jgi:hypothetical protein